MTLESVKAWKFVGGRETFKIVPRYKATGNAPDYNAPKAKAIINKELKGMKWEIDKSTKSDSVLVMGERTGEAHRAYTQSTFPAYMRESGISSTKDFLKVLSQKKGVRFDRLKAEAITRLDKGYMNEHGFDPPNTEFKVASKQLHDNKNIVFRRVRGRIIPMRIPYSKRADLVPF